ncbi:MAG: hypothetical protein KZQ83_10950 [gamma proteobacterium symbiont of Taylorina sp.]|nr:hypothetical protein [gamma proteobacterium symbiont of Taylorina sp.]
MSLLISPVQAMEEESLSWEQQMIEMLLKNTIIAFENPQTEQALSQFSELIKNEYTYEFIIQKIDKFILTNELDEYEDQAEALKEALMEMREYYIRSEQDILKKYNEIKEQQQELEKQRDLKQNNIIEI